MQENLGVPVPWVKPIEGLSSQPWLREGDASSLDSVTEIALGTKHRGCPESIKDHQQHQKKIQRALERSRRQTEWTCVLKGSEPNPLWMNKRDGPSRLLPSGKSKKWRKSLLVSYSALHSGLLYFPLLCDYIRVSVRYCFLLELGMFPKAVPCAQYSHSLSQANFGVNFGRLHKAECLLSCLTSSFSCIIYFSFDRFLTLPD